MRTNNNHCPTTGEEECPYCSGEACGIHNSEPCDCDVLERHTNVSRAGYFLPFASRFVTVERNGEREDQIAYSSSEIKCNNIEEAIEEGWKFYGSDDFSIAKVEKDSLLAVYWMKQEKDFDVVDKLTIAEQLGLEGFIGRTILDNEQPIHAWFELSYSSYLVIPRSILQSAPESWQRRFVKCLIELHEMCEPLQPIDDDYCIKLRGEGGKFIKDPLAQYDRGRRKLPLKQLDSGS